MNRLCAYTKEVTVGVQHEESERWIYLNGNQVIFLVGIDLPNIAIDEDLYIRSKQYDILAGA